MHFSSIMSFTVSPNRPAITSSGGKTDLIMPKISMLQGSVVRHIAQTQYRQPPGENLALPKENAEEKTYQSNVSDALQLEHEFHRLTRSSCNHLEWCEPSRFVTEMTISEAATATVAHADRFAVLEDVGQKYFPVRLLHTDNIIHEQYLIRIPTYLQHQTHSIQQQTRQKTK